MMGHFLPLGGNILSHPFPLKKGLSKEEKAFLDGISK